MTAAAAPAPARVEARAWGWRYASRRAWAVRELSFRIEPGERVLLLGASGSGKSTLLHGLGGVLGGADEGEWEGALTIDGIPAENARGRAGMVLQDPDSQVILSRVGDDVAFGAENLGVPRYEIRRRVGGALDAVGLGGLDLDRSTSALSGGQKQRLALAGVLAMAPSLLLLDEPTANLDPRGVREVRDAVARAAETTGATLVVIEHRVSVWLDLVDRVIVLGPGGGVIADGSPERILGERGAELAAAGVWVPGRPPATTLPAPAAGPVLLRAHELRAARTPEQPGTEPLSVEVRGGRALGIAGPNGAGKSTVALTLAGLLPARGGEVRASPELAGGERGGDPFRWPSKALLTRIGTVFQTPEHQLIASTVREELRTGPRVLGLPAAEIDARVAELLERLRLDRLAEANPHTLSGGEKRRLTVAAVMATRPAVMVFDEPTFGQDANTWAQILGIMAELRAEGRALVCVTHDEELLAALADEVLTIGGSA